MIPRWEKAQEAEKKYWLNATIEDSRKYWSELLSHGFETSLEDFENKDVLDVGCGPNGLIFYLNNAKSRIGLEPLNMDGIVEEWKKPIIRNGLGENIPFADDSFDIVACFNSLDHCMFPEKVMREISRVLRPNGDLLLWFHALKSQFKILRPVLNKIDRPHPHHLTLNETIRLIQNVATLSIVHKKSVDGLGVYGFIESRKLKTKIGNYMMSNIWIKLVKK